MLRFSEEMLLLLLDDKGREFADIPMLSFKYALAGAVLMDLTMESRIDTDENRLFVTDPTPLGDELLDSNACPHCGITGGARHPPLGRAGKRPGRGYP